MGNKIKITATRHLTRTEENGQRVWFYESQVEVDGKVSTAFVFKVCEEDLDEWYGCHVDDEKRRMEYARGLAEDMTCGADASRGALDEFLTFCENSQKEYINKTK